MPNHVHVLITPLAPVPKIMHSLKGYTAREANLLLDRTGLPFWQRESYDHWVRDGEFERIRRYIELNPVRAGLVGEACLYPWSSAACREAGRGAGSPGMTAGPTGDARIVVHEMGSRFSVNWDCLRAGAV
jgi:hypothetical protein